MDCAVSPVGRGFRGGLFSNSGHLIVGLLRSVRMLEICFACVDLEDDCTTAFALRCPRPRLGLVGAAFPSLKTFCLVVQLVRYFKIKVKRSQPSAAPTVFYGVCMVMMGIGFLPRLAVVEI